MTGIRRNGAYAASILAIAILMILAIPSFTPEVSGQGPGIELVDSTGEELGDRSFMTSQVGFDTVDTKEGTRYLLNEKTEIETIETYIKWVDIESGYFDLRITVYPADGGSYGFLSSTGIRIAVYDGGTPYYAVLDQTNGYSAVVIQDESENPPRPHSFQPGQDGNRIRVYTNIAYDSATAPTDALKLTFAFTATSENLHVIQYVSEGEVIEERLLGEDAELGEPPQVKRAGYDLLGWKDSNGKRVTPQTRVYSLPSDVITADWKKSGGGDVWPKTDTEEEDVTEPDGTEVHTETTTIRYEDGTKTIIIEKVIDHPDGDETLMERVETTYPNGKKDITTTLVTETTHDDGSKDILTDYEQRLGDGMWVRSRTVETYDPETRLVVREDEYERGNYFGTLEKRGADVDIEYHEDGSATRTERSFEEDAIGNRQELERVTQYSPEGDMERDSRHVTLIDPGRDPREYDIDYTVMEEDRRVTARLPELTSLDLDNVEDLINLYDYTESFIGISEDDGVIIVPDGILPIIADMGCGLYAHRGGDSVSIDARIVAALSKMGGVLELRIEDATGHMNPLQEKAVGDSFAVSVTLTMDAQYVVELPGSAEIVLEPGYESADAFYVKEDGTLERVDAEYDPSTGAIAFSVSHFSIYMVELHEGSGFPWIWIAIIIAVFAAAIILIAKRRRRDDEE